MSDDIVTRLRDLQERPLKSPVITGTFREAADIIERLRACGDELADMTRRTIICTCRREWVCHKCTLIDRWEQVSRD